MTNCSQDDSTSAKCDLFAEIVRTFGESRLRVTGSSMLPSVQPGDILTIRRKSLAELAVGQIVLMHRNGGLVSHRVVGKREGHLITRGDSLPYLDPPAPENEVLGEVVSIVREGRSFDPNPGWLCRLGAWILRQSRFSMRVFLRLRRAAWAS